MSATSFKIYRVHFAPDGERGYDRFFTSKGAAEEYQRKCFAEHQRDHLEDGAYGSDAELTVRVTKQGICEALNGDFYRQDGDR